MITCRIQHDFDCDEDRLWHVCLFDSDYNRKLYIETLHFPVWRLKDQIVTDATLTRTIEIQPVLGEVSGAVRRVIGDRFAYVEKGTFDRKTKRYKFTITPNVLPEKTDIKGEMYSERLGEKRTRRVIAVEVQVNVFAIGRIIEQKTVDDTRASHERIAAFTRQYLTETRS